LIFSSANLVPPNKQAYQVSRSAPAPTLILRPAAEQDKTDPSFVVIVVVVVVDWT
jgi:hypothetical protein